MSETTMEEAGRCPSCEQPGAEVSNQPLVVDGQRRGRIHVFECQNELCKSNRDTRSLNRWIVQVRPDGTIPNRDEDVRTRGQRSFPKLTPGQESMARATIEDIERAERSRTDR